MNFAKCENTIFDQYQLWFKRNININYNLAIQVSFSHQKLIILYLYLYLNCVVRILMKNRKYKRNLLIPWQWHCTCRLIFSFWNVIQLTSTWQIWSDMMMLFRTFLINCIILFLKCLWHGKCMYVSFYSIRNQVLDFLNSLEIIWIT